MERLIAFIKKEIVLVVSVVLALISVILVPPNEYYATYVDWRTIGLLFGLMLVMVGFQKAGVFQYVGNCFLGRVKSKSGVQGILVFLCFFFSMFITNDVALITFVPFAIVVLKMAEWEEAICFTVVLQTLAANMGSMLTPLGNPQNLYMYAESDMALSDFIGTMLPYTLVAGLLLLGLVLVSRQSEATNIEGQQPKIQTPCLADVIFYLILFAICLLAVTNLLRWQVMVLAVGIAVLIKDRQCYRNVDYSLLLTFIALFIFVGNLGSMDVLMDFFDDVLTGNLCIAAIGLSQIISNVPAALLICEVYGCFKDTIIGVNLGGLGTLIASMASLISYKFVAREYPQEKGRYFRIFTMWNIIFLVILLLVYWGIDGK